MERKAVRHMHKRALLCVEGNEGHDVKKETVYLGETVLLYFRRFQFTEVIVVPPFIHYISRGFTTNVQNKRSDFNREYFFWDILYIDKMQQTLICLLYPLYSDSLTLCQLTIILCLSMKVFTF